MSNWAKRPPVSASGRNDCGCGAHEDGPAAFSSVLHAAIDDDCDGDEEANEDEDA
jgi:hypothetical protein